MNRRCFITQTVVNLSWMIAACNRDLTGHMSVFVSILPMKYFVERIGGERVSVKVMVGPGQNPATYEPLPQQMLELAGAKVFFRIGVPFENVWLGTITENNPNLIIADLRDGIELQDMDTLTDILRDTGDRMTDGGHNHGSNPDPHIWLSPQLVKRQAKTICDTLCKLDPTATELFRSNLTEFQSDLDRLHDEIAAVFEPLPTRRMMVFHPAWGYFAREFGFTQIPVEIQGREPGPRELAQIIEKARSEEIKVIFVQKQFVSDTAQAIAETINGVVVPVDPLAEDYLNNLRNAARTIAESLGES